MIASMNARRGSEMEAAMWRQPADLERLFADGGPVAAAAERVAGRRTFLVGTGTSWHAANQGAHLLRLTGVDAWAVQAADCALYGPRPTPADALILLSHRGTKRHTAEVLARARADGVPTVAIGGIGAPGADLETVPQERSSAFTASHIGALARLTQLAVALGAELGDPAAVPDAVAEALETPLDVRPPKRGLEFTGAGVTQWTAAEGALKVRETSRVYAAAHSVEQLLHGPSVALGEDDALVVLDGGGPGVPRLEEVARAAEMTGVSVHRLREGALSEPLSIFPLTVAVQRIALECAKATGSDPDAFGYDVPGRREAWGAIEL
jgi:glutamine---fructose-6-phosphate transaminase (isomerizing)